MLSVEDIVDVLTLKDNGEKLEDYATALQLLLRAEVFLGCIVTGACLIFDKGVPDVRRLSAFRRVWCRVYNHDEYVRLLFLPRLTFSLLRSWDGIRQTANVTDTQLTARFRATALYHTLTVILPIINSTPLNEMLPEGFDLDQSQCLPVPLMPETSSRFPGMPAEMVGELARDFRVESTCVEQMRLEDVYFRVRELAMEDVGYERQ